MQIFNNSNLKHNLQLCGYKNTVNICFIPTIIVGIHSFHEGLMRNI